MRYRYKPSKDGTEIFAKGSSLALHIHHDDNYELSFYVFNRRTHSIISHYKISLMEHCRNSMLDIEPIKRPRK